MTTFKITIAEPCHEKWENMMAIGCGAFCHSCQKKVVDYTQKTSVEIAQIFGKNKGATCGKFKPSQLAHVYEYMSDKPARNYWFNKGLIGAGLSILVATTQVKSTNIPTTRGIENILKINELNSLPTANDEPTITNEITITGIVIDKNKEPLIGAVIVLQNYTPIGAVADFDGKFSLKIPAAYFEKNSTIILQVKSIGYEVQNVTISHSKASEFQTIIMTQPIELGFIGLIITKPTPATKRPETPIEHELWYDYKFNGGE